MSQSEGTPTWASADRYGIKLNMFPNRKIKAKGFWGNGMPFYGGKPSSQAIRDEKEWLRAQETNSKCQESFWNSN